MDYAVPAVLKIERSGLVHNNSLKTESSSHRRKRFALRSRRIVPLFRWSTQVVQVGRCPGGLHLV